MVQPAAVANAGMAAALLQHDRVRRSTELPMFFGRREKDTITARNLVLRVETAAEIAGWPDDARRCAEFFMILRDRALVWWETLEDAGIDNKVWNDVKAAFLKAYERKYTAKTTCTNFSDINQRRGEPVHDYFLRLQETFGKLTAATPEDIATVKMAMPVAPAAINADTCKQAKAEGIKDMGKFFKTQLFIAGLDDQLRSKVMEAGKTSIYDCLDIARELETINSDRKRGAGAIDTIAEANEEEDVAAEAKLDDDELVIINAIRSKKGRPPMRAAAAAASSNFRNNGGNNGSNNKTVQCRYCKKNGHFQKDCNSRRRDRAPMVDAQGKPYQKKVNNIEGETAEAGRINTVSVEPEAYPLNWM